jgi:hypothetical protein
MSTSHESIALERFEAVARDLRLPFERGQGKDNRIPITECGVGVYYQRGDLRVELPEATVVVEVESSGGVTNLAKYWECFEAGRLTKPIRLLHLFRQKSVNDYASHIVVWKFLARKMARELGDRFTAHVMLYRDADKAGLDEALTVFKNMLARTSQSQPTPALARLLDKARSLAATSAHPDAATFDVERWLLMWLTVPQPALGGRKPQDLLNEPHGVEAVERIMGALLSDVVV